MENRRNGQIITFYSYKGGVGRTFTLANVAALLIHWGYKVLCVDWDIEAPGLRYYFEHAPVVEGGLYELIAEMSKSPNVNWRKYARRVNIPRSGKRIDIIYASGDDHEGVVTPLNWDQLYNEENLGAALENVRREWKAEYDFILIDSRTGVSDASAVCIAQLPDTLVFLLTANQQSLKGSVSVVKKAIRARQGLPVERNALRLFPVVSRFDAREEYDLAVDWKRRLKRELSEFYSSWVSNEAVASELLEQTTIPYVPKWNFGEQIIGRSEPDSPTYISYYFSNIAAIIARGFKEIDNFLDFRDAYVKSAEQSTAASQKFIYDAFISSPRQAVPFSVELRILLLAADFKVFHDRLDAKPRRDHVEQMNDALSRSKNLIVLLDGSVAPQQSMEINYFLKRSIIEDFDRRIIPVNLAEGRPKGLPTIMRNFRIISAYKRSAQLVAGEIAAEITSARGQ